MSKFIFRLMKLEYLKYQYLRGCSNTQVTRDLSYHWSVRSPQRFRHTFPSFGCEAPDTLGGLWLFAGSSIESGTFEEEYLCEAEDIVRFDHPAQTAQRTVGHAKETACLDE